MNGLYDPLYPLGDNPMTANTDGGCSPNPGRAGCGFILRDAEGRQVAARGYYLGPDNTNNAAEFAAVVKAAECALEHGASSLHVLSDSRLAVMILSGRWKAKLPHLQTLRRQALDALNQIPCWSIEWVERERNVPADTMAHNARVFGRDVSYTLPVLEPKETYTDRSYEASGHFCRQHRGRWANWHTRSTAAAQPVRGQI